MDAYPMSMGHKNSTHKGFYPPMKTDVVYGFDSDLMRRERLGKTGKLTRRLWRRCSGHSTLQDRPHNFRGSIAGVRVVAEAFLDLPIPIEASTRSAQ